MQLSLNPQPDTVSKAGVFHSQRCLFVSEVINRTTRGARDKGLSLTRMFLVPVQLGTKSSILLKTMSNGRNPRAQPEADEDEMIEIVSRTRGIRIKIPYVVCHIG